MTSNYRFRTYKQQIDILIQTSYISYMKIDESMALNVIKNVGYGSILKYLECFKIIMTFNDVYRIYLFDSVLKSESMRLIGLVERNVKTVIANTFISKHEFNSLCYADKNSFAQSNKYEKFYFEKIKRISKGGKLPFWIVLESLSLGDIVRLFDYMSNQDKASIAQIFNKRYHDFECELKLIKKIRNICAHFNELINRVDFTQLEKQENRISKFFKIIISWIPDMDEWNKFIKRLKVSLEEVSNEQAKQMLKNLLNLNQYG